MESTQKQLTVRKALPRGKPWPKGVSGNPHGRPKGAKNKLSLAVQEGVSRALEELAKPLMLDKSRPYESWDGYSGYFYQDGLHFDKVTLEALPIDGPPPVQPPRLDPGERRSEVYWKKRRLYLQNGWAFDPGTWLPVRT